MAKKVDDFKGIGIRPIELLSRLLIMAGASGVKMQAEDVASLGLLLMLWVGHFEGKLWEEVA